MSPRTPLPPANRCGSSHMAVTVEIPRYTCMLVRHAMSLRDSTHACGFDPIPGLCLVLFFFVENNETDTHLLTLRFFRFHLLKHWKNMKQAFEKHWGICCWSTNPPWAVCFLVSVTRRSLTHLLHMQLYRMQHFH